MKKIVTIMMLLVMTTALCACKGGTDKDGNSSDSVYYGGKITVGITQDLDSLDPHKAVAAGTKEVLYNIFEGLIKVDKNGNFVPAVASSYEISDDGLKYTFELRSNVKFHNGKTVTPEDVIYSLKRAAGLSETPEADVSTVSAFNIISDITNDNGKVVVTLSSPNTELIGYFTSSIIPCDYTEQATKPIGTGPFKFVSYSPLTSIVLEKNADYYIEGCPYLDGVTFKICANTDSAFLELLGGSIDVFPYLTNDQAAQLEGKMNIVDGTMNLVQALFLNNAVAPFDNVKVRQAVCYAIDRQAIINVVAGGKGEIIGSNMFPSFSSYYDKSLVNAYPYDQAKAKELLEEAGLADGFTFTITVPSNYDFHVRTAQVVADQLAKVGITAKIELVEWSTWLSDVYVGRNYTSTIIGLDSQLAPSDVLRFYPSTSSKNFMNYSNAEFDEVFESAKSTTRSDAKIDNYKTLQQILTGDAAAAYLQSPAQLVAVSRDLDGYTFYPVYVQDIASIHYVVDPKTK